MNTPVSLTFPPGWDPLALSNTEVAETVRRLWLQQANDALREAFAEERLKAEAELADTVPLTEAGLNLFVPPPYEQEDCQRCAGYGVIERSAVAGGPFPQCPKCSGSGRVSVRTEFPSPDALWPPPDHG